MKMIIAIVQNKFVDELIDKFYEENISVTKVSSSGGFFKAGNTTLLIGSKEEELEHVYGIFKEVTQTEEIKDERGHFEISGATLFVLDVEKSLRI